MHNDASGGREHADNVPKRGPIPRLCTMPERAADPTLGMLALPTRLLTGGPRGHGGSIPPVGAMRQTPQHAVDARVGEHPPGTREQQGSTPCDGTSPTVHVGTNGVVAKR